MRKWIPLLLTLPLVSAAGAQQGAFKLLASGGMPKAGGYIPKRLTLSATAPAGLRKAPADLKAPRYGQLEWGSRDQKSPVLLIVDEPAGSPARLFVDSNRNGDMTDDPQPQWTPREYMGRNMAKHTQYSGGAMIQPATNAPARRLGMYRFDPTDTGRAAFKDILFYYSDYIAEGEVTLGEKKYKAYIHDSQCVGDFRGRTEGANGVALLIDVNGNGSIDRRGEHYDVSKPFNIGGTTYEIRDIQPDGSSLKVVRSNQQVAEIAPPMDLSPGKKAIGFKAKLMTGEAIQFPETFKGKLVLLDFWATWCGPCIVELPHLTAAYEKWRPRGLEILGISLDQANQAEKVTKFTQERKMPWPQVYDGKYWQAEVAALYAVDSIPRAYLVDGNTGEILASGSDLRGANLDKTLEKAFSLKRQ